MSPQDVIEPRAAHAFRCKAARFAEYRTVTVDGALCIVGSGIRGEHKTRLFFDRVDNTKLLLSLLELYEKLGDGLYNHVDARISNEQIAAIVEWCSLYGLPMEERGSADSDSSYPLWTDNGLIGFRVSSFYNRLRDLYTCYELWCRIAFGDVPNNYYSTHSISVQECYSHLKARMVTLDIKLCPNFENDPPTFTYECDGYIETAKAQLFLLCCTNPGAPVIGACSVCGKPFPKRRKNNTLCDDCHRRAYERTRAKRKKEASKHAKDN